MNKKNFLIIIAGLLSNFSFGAEFLNPGNQSEGVAPFRCPFEGCGEFFFESSYFNIHLEVTHSLPALIPIESTEQQTVDSAQEDESQSHEESIAKEKKYQCPECKELLLNQVL